jgi:thiamine biosynthesis lipoprotein
MGTEVVVLTTGRAPAGAVARVRELFATREAALSRFLPTSELTRLNRSAGRAMEVSPLMLETVDAAIRAASTTGGAFDPTLGRQMAAIGYDRPFGLPSRVTVLGMPPEGPGGGWREIAIDRARRTVSVPVGIALDFGGIAKGMAVDAAARLLGDAGVDAALVSAGGDMRVAGAGAGDWQVGLSETPAPWQITLSGGALATSSSSRRTWIQDGIRRHHLLDPRTGAPADSGLRSVSVAARTCEQAEVAAKAAFVLGAERGAEFLDALGLAGLLTQTAGAPIRVGAWPSEVAA